jgi:hypothetical protein
MNVGLHEQALQLRHLGPHQAIHTLWFVPGLRKCLVRETFEKENFVCALSSVLPSHSPVHRIPIWYPLNL